MLVWGPGFLSPVHTSALLWTAWDVHHYWHVTSIKEDLRTKNLKALAWQPLKNLFEYRHVYLSNSSIHYFILRTEYLFKKLNCSFDLKLCMYITDVCTWEGEKMFTHTHTHFVYSMQILEKILLSFKLNEQDCWNLILLLTCVCGGHCLDTVAEFQAFMLWLPHRVHSKKKVVTRTLNHRQLLSMNTWQHFLL